MNKRNYIQPVITIVAFKVEKGHQASANVMGIHDENFITRLLYGEDQYSTSDPYTEYTDDYGNFTTGTWSD